MDASLRNAPLADAPVLAAASSHPLTRARQERSGKSLRTLLHGAVITVAWLLFVAGWIKVWRDSSPGMVVSTLGLLGATLVVSVALTWLWIWHNVSIFNRKGSRLARATTTFSEETDFLGHRLDANWDAIAASQLVIPGASPEGATVLVG